MRHSRARVTPSCWMMLGDNAYTAGTDAEYQAAVFQNKYEAMLRKSVLWPTLGNHDGQSAKLGEPDWALYSIFTLPAGGEAGGVPSGTEAFYAFDTANIHFVCLDSYETDNAPGSPMLTWLDADLTATQQEWAIVFWHHPPYTKGTHDSDTDPELVAMRQNVLPILDVDGVDLVLCGHSHDYERSALIDGHYGDSSTFGPSFVVDGGDGRIGSGGPYRKPAAWRVPHSGCVYLVAGTSGVGHHDVPARPSRDDPVPRFDGLARARRARRSAGRPLRRQERGRSRRLHDDQGPSLRRRDSWRDRPARPGVQVSRYRRRSRHGVERRLLRRQPVALRTGPARLRRELDRDDPSLFGPNPSNKLPTTYFRLSFALPLDPAAVDSARLWVNYDDGFVARMNGAEVARSPSLGSGPVGYATLASSHEAGTFELFPVPPGALVAGTNVLAIDRAPDERDEQRISSSMRDSSAMRSSRSSGACAAGSADVFRLNGSGGGGARSIDLAAPRRRFRSRLPPPPATMADFAFFGVLATPASQDAFGALRPESARCAFRRRRSRRPRTRFLFASSFFPDPSAVLSATPAPWVVTLPAGAPAGFVATLQGVILDGRRERCA